MARHPYLSVRQIRETTGKCYTAMRCCSCPAVPRLPPLSVPAGAPCGVSVREEGYPSRRVEVALMYCTQYRCTAKFFSVYVVKILRDYLHLFLRKKLFSKNDFEFLVFSIFSYLIAIITQYNKLFLKGI